MDFAPAFPVEQTVRTRSSVRTYEQRPLSDELKAQIRAYFSTLSNPFSVPVSFFLLETAAAPGGEKLGTYGVIKGADCFIGATVPNDALALEALGYSFEKLILYITTLGLGTCWLGGTFKRSAFASALEVKENELFPAISPVGYPLGKKRVTESVMRWMAKADQRKDWHSLFFFRDFSHPLSEAEAGDYAFPLEMLRLAPSATNRQPWRVVLDFNALHFYREQVPGASRLPSLDFTHVDLGIAACHLHLAALEKGLTGSFQKLPDPVIFTPEKLKYAFSWVIS